MRRGGLFRVLAPGHPITGWTDVTKPPAKKAAALKALTEAKRAQWPPAISPHKTETPPEQPERLLTKVEVCAIANATFPSIWGWMRAGTFPRSRVVGGRSMWLSSEIAAWLGGLPVRRLKGDAEVEVA
jgi:predicted DNA-binding transcriptional regulator AlpA